MKNLITFKSVIIAAIFVLFGSISATAQITGGAGNNFGFAKVVITNNGCHTTSVYENNKGNLVLVKKLAAGAKYTLFVKKNTQYRFVTKRGNRTYRAVIRKFTRFYNTLYLRC